MMNSPSKIESLREIVMKKTILALIKKEISFRELNNKLPKELSEEIVDKLAADSLDTKGRLIYWKQNYMNLCMGVTEKHRMGLIADSHKYGLCQEQYEGLCHLCNE